jgi:oleandomycin transport system ATP-binding protein
MIETYGLVKRYGDVTALDGVDLAVGQYASIDEELTGHHNLSLVGRLLGLRRALARQRADELPDEFGLSDAGGRAVKTYSGGMRRRIDLAASLVSRPRVLFLDEPTTGLDPLKRGAPLALSAYRRSTR